MNRPSSPGFVSHLLVYALVTIGFAGSVGVGMVWMRHQISLTANANKALETRLREIERRIEDTTAAVAEQEDPSRLAERNVAWNLQLAPPSQGQVLRVAADLEGRLRAKHNREIFTDRPEAVSFRVASQP